MSDVLNDSTWIELQALFRRAIDLPAPARSELLKQADAYGAACRKALERLLTAHDSNGSMLDRPPHLEAEPALGDDLDTLINQRIGNYLLTELIGIGGLGAVYRAWQEHPPRWVAVKLPRFAFESPELLRRFEFEAEVLGRLQHPSIAQIIEAGTFERPAGPQPFIAMELIDGLPLGEFVRRHNLSLKQRIQLLIRVCEGVYHAHQRGVIHHDLKPSNILVIDEDGAAGRRSGAASLGAETPAGSASPPASCRAAQLSSAQPKILDFGIARWVDAQQGSASQERGAHLLGTLAYMSPEQLAGQRDASGTRCDIYALGVIAFELFAGRLPLEIPAGASLLEAMQLARTQRPQRLKQAAPRLSADLDAIVGKAMEPDASRRYSSTAELAGDLANFLEHRPVLARSPNAWYQSRMFARRHAALVSGGALALTALIVGLLGFAWKAQAEARARAEADARLRAAVRSNSQIVEWVEHGLANLPGSTPLRLALAQAGIEALEALWAEAPPAHAVSDELQHALGYAHQRLGEVRLVLGEPEAALTSFREALLIRQRHHASKGEVVRFRRALGVGHWKVGDALTELGQFDDAIQCYEVAREIHESLEKSPGEPLSHDAVYVGLAHQRLGIAKLRSDRPEEALPELDHALDWFCRGLSHEPENVQLLRGQARSSRLRAAALLALGRHDGPVAALDLALASVEKLAAVRGPTGVWERTERASVLLTRTELHRLTGNHAEAEADASVAFQIADELARADPRNAESGKLLREAERALLNTQTTTQPVVISPAGP
jgi:serine/threonine protein kinase